MKSLWSVENRIKAALFVLAILLWFFVVSDRDYEADFSIPLDVKGLEAGCLFVQDPPKLVQITCKGRGRDLLVWRYFSGSHLELNISGLSVKRAFPLVPEMVTVPAGFPIRDLAIVSPETLRLHIDRLAERRVPVRATCDISPAPGYALVGAARCEPDSILIRGPQVLVRQVDEVETQDRRFARLSGPFEERLPLKGAFSPKILLATHQVLVRATIEAIEQVSRDSISVEVRNVPRGHRSIVFPAYVNVILEGPKSSLAVLDTVPPRLVLDYERDWSDEQSSYRPTLEGPPFIELVAMDPPDVAWKVQKVAGWRRR
jgi:hypothetical protein